jgi:hypothetical protein
LNITLKILLYISISITFAQSDSAKTYKLNLDNIIGTWIIDLRPTPDSESYLKKFSIENIHGKSFSGKFYNTEFENGQFNLDWDKLYFAFTTKDANSTYFLSGYIEGDHMYGISFSPERSFTAPWTGYREILVNDIESQTNR